LELRFIGFAGDRPGRLRAQTRLADAEVRLAIASELAFGRRNPRRPQGRFPIGIDPVEILDRVSLYESIEFEIVVPGGFRRRSGLGRGGFARQTERLLDPADPGFHVLNVPDRLSALL